MIKIPLEKDISREDWLELRRRGIGGSDAAAGCGISRYKSPMELWLEKTGKVADDGDSEAAYWGRTLEAIVREEFTKRSGLNVRTLPFMLQSEEHPFMLANVDGIVSDQKYGTCIFEAKTASAFKAKDWDLEIPEEYYVQIQHYMAVTGYNAAYIAALIGGNRFIRKCFERDDRVIEMLIKLERQFWAYVENDEMPPPDGSEASKKILAELYPEAKSGETVDLGEDGLSWVMQYEEASEQEKQLSEIKNLAANKLKEMLKDREIGLAGERKVIWRNIKSERLNTAALKEKEPEIYGKYLTDTSYRRFDVK
jgi:putative phage-type endonuclease